MEGRSEGGREGGQSRERGKHILLAELNQGREEGLEWKRQASVSPRLPFHLNFTAIRYATLRWFIKTTGLFLDCPSFTRRAGTQIPDLTHSKSRRALLSVSDTNMLACQPCTVRKHTPWTQSHVCMCTVQCTEPRMLNDNIIVHCSTCAV